MMSLRTLLLVACVAYAHGAIVKRTIFGHHFSAPSYAPAPSAYAAPASAYAPAPSAYAAAPPAYGSAPSYVIPEPVSAPAVAPAAPAPAPSAAPVSSYDASSYGTVSYGAPAPQSYGPIFYLEEDRPGLKARIHEFKSRIMGSLGYMKGSLLAAKGQMLMKKANLINQKGERLVGIGQTLRAYKTAHSEPLLAPVQNYYSAPVALPAAPAY